MFVEENILTISKCIRLVFPVYSVNIRINPMGEGLDEERGDLTESISIQ